MRMEGLPLIILILFTVVLWSRRVDKVCVIFIPRLMVRLFVLIWGRPFCGPRKLMCRLRGIVDWTFSCGLLRVLIR